MFCKLIHCFFLAAFSACLIESFESTIVLKPSKTSHLQAGLVFVQGAEIPAKNYFNYSTLLQTKFNGSLWIALLEFPMSLPDPLQIASLMTQALSDLRLHGFNYSSTTPFYFGGHSLGGVVLMGYLVDNYISLSARINFMGVILEGSFVQKAKLNQTRSGSFPPILTLGAELDGLARLTRIAESYYFDNIDDHYSKKNNKTRTFVVDGMNHFQFVGWGKPTPTIIRNDIKPEIETYQAQHTVTSLIVAFLDDTLNELTSVDRVLLDAYQNSTANLVGPLIDGLLAEGFYQFKPPCYQQPTLQPPQCSSGSWWSQVAQTYMGGIVPSRMNITDTFRPAAKIPEHFPSLKSNCTTDQREDCWVNIMTYTENVYSITDQIDNGFLPVAALEARTKMMSRQAVTEAYTRKKYNFNTTDGGNVCAQINQETIKYALLKAPAKTVKRYLDKGRLLKPGSDVDYKTGFTWLNTKLEFNERTDAKNQTFIDLRSPTLRFPTDYNIKVVAGLHYCKVLSPARALEWIYIDSVKP